MENRQYDNYLQTQEYLGTRVSDDWTETAVKYHCQESAPSWRTGLGLVTSDPARLASCSLYRQPGRQKETEVCWKPRALEVFSHQRKFHSVLSFLGTLRCVRWASLDNVGYTVHLFFLHSPVSTSSPPLNSSHFRWGPACSRNISGILVREDVKIRWWTFTD